MKNTKATRSPIAEKVARTGWSWESTSFDFDNDGDQDLFVAMASAAAERQKTTVQHFWCHDIYTGTSRMNRELAGFFRTNMALNFGEEGMSWNGFEHNALLMKRNGQGVSRIEFLAGVASEFDSRNVISDDLNADGRLSSTGPQTVSNRLFMSSRIRSSQNRIGLASD